MADGSASPVVDEQRGPALLGSGDFTIETTIRPLPSAVPLPMVGVDLAPLIPNDGKWHTIEVTRNGSARRSFVHSEETIDGVLFVSTSEYDADSKMVRKTLTRADMVKA